MGPGPMRHPGRGSRYYNSDHDFNERRYSNNDRGRLSTGQYEFVRKKNKSTAAAEEGTSNLKQSNKHSKKKKSPDPSSSSSTTSSSSSDTSDSPSSDDEDGDEDGEALTAEAKQVYAAFQSLSTGYKAVPWYNFKTFENLSLLKLYMLQHRLVQADHDILGDGDTQSGFSTMPRDEKEWKQWKQMRKDLKEYHESLLLFKQISQLHRSSQTATSLTNMKLANATGKDHYLKQHDAAISLSLNDEALNYEKDPVRAFARKTFRPSSLSSTSSPFKAEVSTYRSKHPSTIGAPPGSGVPKLPGTGKLPEGQKRWIFDNRIIDYLLRLLVGVIAGLSLLAPMIILCYVRRREYILVTGCFSVLIFALMVSLVGDGATHEVMVAVATYSAVIVVFVGQTYFPGN